MSVEQPNDGGRDPKSNNEVVDAIQALATSYRDSQQQRSGEHHETITWHRRGAIGLAAYTALTFCLVVLGYCSLRSSSDSNAVFVRAWVSANVVSPNVPLKDMTTPAFSVGYSNVGHEPAFNVVGRARPHVIPMPRGDIANWYDLLIWSEIPELKQDRICAGLDPQAGREVLFPNGNYGNLAVDSSNDVQMDAVKNRIGILLIYGCFAYRTDAIPGPHHTGFCYFLKPDPAKPFAEWQGNPIQCPAGNYAD